MCGRLMGIVRGFHEKFSEEGGMTSKWDPRSGEGSAVSIPGFTFCKPFMR